jgi:hypothetical protein
MTIAGHNFPAFGPCPCGIHGVTIRNAQRDDVHRPGIAHAGNLTLFEYEQIAAARLAEDLLIAAAMEDLSR